MENSKDFDVNFIDISLDDLRDIDLLQASIFDEIARKNVLSENEESEIEDYNIYPPKNRKRKRMVIPSESESEIDDVEKFVNENIDRLSASTSQKWLQPKGHQPSVIAFTELTGMRQPFASQLRNAAPGEYFSLMVPDEIFEEIAIQTNLFAEQQGLSAKPSSGSNNWKPTTKVEIKLFFGLILYMGLVKLPKINLYWSTDRVFGQTFAASVMSRNRFELLLQKLHFTSNDTADVSDRIYKIRPLLDSLNKTFKNIYAPKEDICIDESQVPFRGRIIFRQYNKSKRHKYGMKLFKLCTLPGYTCKLELYAGKNNEVVNTTPTRVVMSLCEHILGCGHTLATDNWYTSLELANELLDKDTHLVGTLRKNRRGLPKAVVDSKLKPGEVIARENERGICVLKWKDKRDVLMLSTKHSKGFSKITKKGKVIRKPRMVLAYNKTKSAVDMSDQMAAYSSPRRKTVKWYKKIGIELILNTAIVNAWIMYNENKKKVKV
ncbi:hypothetical protein HF086_011384 [Spodoptera exigua]|uniref:PiggyBac transposable element-derived protein domain-containing protein n=1 Tax=Spodoptera exigua TaxID=7107 RepID=A0A922N2D0_SPOEX|nr:hypothetical protein HF086_011384 [Spodoptera exigua]